LEKIVMAKLHPTIAAAVATKGPAADLTRLLQSLADQTYPVTSILIIDQNPDNRLSDIIADFPALPIEHHRTPELVGLCRNRNFGWQQAQEDIVIFPDDDCWYPADFMAKAVELFERTGADIVCGRPTNTMGKSINGRFGNTPCWVDRKSVWFSQIEWAFLAKRDVLVATAGFDEELGVGAGTPWGAGEMQDVSLKAFALGYREYYDPALVAHHPESVVTRGAGDWYLRVPSYARGMGFVLAKHHYSLSSALVWSARPIVGALLMALRFDFWRAGLGFKSAAGRFHGYAMQRRIMAFSPPVSEQVKKREPFTGVACEGRNYEGDSERGPRSE
jgi:glycosyltransferase involved in cell wall biosynthesis